MGPDPRGAFMAMFILACGVLIATGLLAAAQHPEGSWRSSVFGSSIYPRSRWWPAASQRASVRYGFRPSLSLSDMARSASYRTRVGVRYERPCGVYPNRTTGGSRTAPRFRGPSRWCLKGLGERLGAPPKAPYSRMSSRSASRSSRASAASSSPDSTLCTVEKKAVDTSL